MRVDHDSKVYLAGSLVTFLFELVIGTPLPLALYGAFFSWGWLAIHTIIILVTGNLHVFYPQ